MRALDDIPPEWLYPSTLEAAAKVQRYLAGHVVLEDALERRDLVTVSGVDVSNNLFDPDKMVYAAVVTLDFPSLSLTDEACEARSFDFPYVPGFLAFREIPALLAAIEQLPRKPELILVDGHGISHPRGLGIASHLGVILDCPTIGVAKSILVGRPAEELSSEPGKSVPLIWQNRQIGVCLRTKKRTNPLFISPGHRVSMDSAVSWVIRCLTKYRLPEPTRQAHLAANRCRLANQQKPA